MAKRYYDSMYYQDAGMIKEDKSAIANLPQGVIMKEYPKNPSYRSYDLNDTISGIDNQLREDSKGGKKGSMPEKY